MAVQDLQDIALTPDGDTDWGTDMRAAFDTLHKAFTSKAASVTSTATLTTERVQDLTLLGNCAPTFPTVTNTHEFVLIVRQDGTGGRTVTWPASVKWQAGLAPYLSSGANNIDMFHFITTDSGTTWFGLVVAQDLQ